MAVDIEDETLEEDKINNNKICHCSNPFIKKINGEINGQQRRPLIPLNSYKNNNILISEEENIKNNIERHTSNKLPKKVINNTKRARKSYGGTSTVSFWRDAAKQIHKRCRACDGIIV